MPLIEFLGYSQAEAKERMERYSEVLRDLDFADDFIFVVGSGSIAYGLNGIEQPVIRVISRWQERIDETRRALSQFEDIESWVIDFTPRSDADGVA